ncbi:hypothetical protein M407DRAFT_9370 [Tulasnella calospora MUT 4182]|uniref:Uncharacterized protein n=1 Tax=Tulasnella calospora MUT 4182 TaxID=1051891 RepID=A0A0C3KQ80_9AGAM|nr:hypothetical protein M407DRAFT_9370 [Tulasnella calospora MUT 4182]
MKVMVTYNVETELAIANGARGTIVDIVLDENEPEFERDDPEVELVYPPAYVLVKLDRSKGTQLEGLREGIVPIEPMERNFRVKLPLSRKTKTVHRRQLPLTAAYAFTDCREQGQTLGQVIVDIAPVPSGSINGFNAYVALSRSSGRDTIRLLRDFDDVLFTKAPCDKLTDEDTRLEALDKETHRKWNFVFGS